MMNKAMRLSAVGFGLASMLFLSGCGDDEPKPITTPTVTATATETATASPTGTAAATQLVHLVCPAPVGTVDALTDPNDQWAAAYINKGDPAYPAAAHATLWPVAFGKVTGKASDGSTFSDAAVTKPGATKEGAIKCSFTGTWVDKDDSGQTVTAQLKGTVWVTVKY